MSSVSGTLTQTATSTGPAAASSTDASGSGSATNKPLLFFVALGFGVVFTNLWIIVGVKYCFRYNHRARQAMLNADGDQIGMGNMQRPRRRREKKLMSMEEVNERFPLVKYKLWRAGREQSGLPTTGGITAPNSRAPSIRERDALKRNSTEDPTAGEADLDSATVHEEPQHDPSSQTKDFAAHVEPQGHTTALATSTQDKKSTTRASVDEVRSNQPESAVAALPSLTTVVTDEEEFEPISTAVPNEVLNQPAGDSCAICIENLEDDDEVRGLTCGHAFHAGCLDPWLTSRRACCPLCKADYYVPKQQEGENGAEGDGIIDPDNPRAPPATHQPRVNLGGTTFIVYRDARYGFPILTRESPAMVRQRNLNNAQGEGQGPQQRRGVVHWVATAPSRLPAMPWSRRGQQQLAATPGTTTTTPELEASPAQLEAGAVPR